ncbi:MAG: hypothetical protein M1113_03255 [Candidatus Thermoplasmatota archaeon]|nr:hypothetical protein [Candidatus Thermoplasmatota archaeon]
MPEINADLMIFMEREKMNDFLASIDPDNMGKIKPSLNENHICLTITDAKISTITNVIDDILRCYDVFEKLMEE